MDDKELQDLIRSVTVDGAPSTPIKTTTRKAAHRKTTKNRRKVHYAAPLGFFVLLFAVIGVISTITAGVRWIQKATDDAPLRQELYDFLNPVMQFCPPTFEDAGEGEQDALLLAAVYRVTEAERIRQLREKDDECAYTLDETQWRMKIPDTVIADSFAHLFGEAELIHKTVGEIEYVPDLKFYYVPITINTSGYVPVLGSIREAGGTYVVQVAYVADADVEVDEKGNDIQPSFNMGKYTQQYIVRRGEEDTLTLISVQAVEK